MALVTIIAITLSLAAGLVYPAAVDRELECGPETQGVYVAVSSEADVVDGDYLRWVEVHWFGMAEVEIGDWVGLWSHDPSEGLDDFLNDYAALTTDGSFRTERRWDGSLLPGDVNGMEDSCLPLWAGYVHRGVLTHSTCLKVRPNWMSDLQDTLQGMRLSKTVLPGAHDAGASGHFGLSIIGDIVGRWSFTQDESFWQQLVLGVRYFDVRIAYYNGTEEKFFINHGEVRIAPLRGYLDNVVAFLSQTEEIVIFDIHQASVGFVGHPERHEELMALLEDTFQQWLVPNSLAPDPTLGEIWANGKLIVTYPSGVASRPPSFWNNVHHLWGNVNQLEDLEAFLYTSIPTQVNRGSLWSAMAELTPTAFDVAIDRWGGLRGAATVTNTPVTQWVREDFWDQVNIVAMDFFLSSNIPSLAVEANKMKAQCVGKPKRSSYRAARWSNVTDNNTDSNGSIPRIWIWVSALASTSEGQVTQRRLEVNWDVPEIFEGDWVGIFDKDPSEDSSTPREVFHPVEKLDHVLAEASLPHLNIHASMAEGSCLGFWAAYIRDGSPLVVDCIKVHPRWMALLKEHMQEVPLSHVVIPGTHDSGTYTPYTPAADNALMKYAITQDESIYKQLVLGNRYIDLRAGYLSGDQEEPYWVVHGVTAWRPFRNALREVKQFVRETSEVVILEVGGFTWFESSATHEGCIALILEELEDVLLHKAVGWDVKLGDVLGSSSSLIVVYDHNEANNQPLMWSGISGRWANAQSLDQLESYMIKVFDVEGPPSRPWTMGGQLTPLAGDVVGDTLGGLRPMADQVNRNVTRWMRERWWEHVSIFSCDFVLSAGYVELAIEINMRRLN